MFLTRTGIVACPALADQHSYAPCEVVEVAVDVADAVLVVDQVRVHQGVTQDQQAVIAEAQLACRAALQDVGRTVLRAPVDIFIVDVLVTPGAQVESDAPIVVVERTDGRVFTPPAGLRAPDPQDLPASSCPGTIEELRAADDAADTSAIQKSTLSSPRHDR